MILFRESKNVLEYLFECAFICCDSVQINKTSCTIYSNVYDSNTILCRAPKKVVKYLFECIFHCCDYIQSIKVPLL